MIAIAINIVETNEKYNIAWNVSKQIDGNSQTNPIVNSIIGYDSEIFLLQSAHFPNCSINDIIGIFLYRGILFLHKGQKERGEMIDKPFGIR